MEGVLGVEEMGVDGAAGVLLLVFDVRLFFFFLLLRLGEGVNVGSLFSSSVGISSADSYSATGWALRGKRGGVGGVGRGCGPWGFAADSVLRMC